MIKTLMNLGFGQRNAEVYAFLAVNGSQKALVIAEAIRIRKRQVYRVLKKLEKQKIVSITENPRAHFEVLPFDKLLDLLVKVNLQEARQIEQNKASLIALWSTWVEKG
jgi:sugar-specific transcriptional regulator TrmB